VHHFYIARANGTNDVAAPPEIVELDLIEKFHWTPMEIDQIPLGKLQRLYIAMEQRESSKQAAAEIIAKRDKKRTNNQSQPVVNQKRKRK
jgi:hypothetical protein